MRRPCTFLLVLVSAGALPVRAATAVEALWAGQIAAHSAVCTSGTSADITELESVAKRFHTRLAGLSAAGNVYFDVLDIDTTTKGVSWRACAPVASGAKAPDGFTAVEMPPLNALFAVCRESEATSDCTRAALDLVVTKADAAAQSAIAALRGRGAKVAALPAPITEAVRKLVEESFVDPKNILLPRDAAAGAAADLKDPNKLRRPVSAPATAAATAPLPPARISLTATPIPPELMDALNRALAATRAN